MPTDMKLDSNTHDIDLTSGGADVFSSTTQVLGQRLKIAILLRRTEWYPNINLGVPYHSQFFTNKNNKAFIDSFYQGYILSVEGIERLISYSSIVTPRRVMEVEFVVKTTEGTIESFLLEV